jgi:predicted Holliday junction resolvase-like endonuclease
VAVANSLHSEAPIGTLVSDRCRELGVSKAELVRQAGYRNVAKALRRLNELCSGDLSKSAVLIHGLPGAAVNLGKIVEKIVPSFSSFSYEAGDCRALFEPIDYLVFSGLAKRNRVEALFFVDVKSGHARLSSMQHSIKKAIESGAVRFGITEK